MKPKNLFKIMFLFLAIGITSCSINATDDLPDTGVENSNGNGNGNGNGSGNGNAGGNGNGNSALTIEASEVRVYENTVVTFIVRDGSGADVTATSVINIDGATINGSSYSLVGVGVKDVQATNGAETTSILNVEVIAPSYTTKVLIEDYTGTWCGYCPRLTTAISDVRAQTNNAVAIAIHDDNAMGYQYVDEMQVEYSVTGFPTGKLNRTTTWNGGSTSQALSLTNIVQPLGLAIDSSVSGNMMNITVKVGFDFDVVDSKLVVCVVEDGLIHDQRNYYDTDSSSPWFNQGDPIQGFVHDDVMRTSLTDIFGDAIPNNESEAEDEYIANFNVAVPSSVSDVTNAKIVAFVLGANGDAMNVQEVHLGSNQDFD